MEMDQEKAFAERLETLIRDKLGVTQSEFAQKVGVAQGFISTIIAGKSGPSAGLMSGVYLNYPEHIGWLLTGVAEEQPGCRLFADIDAALTGMLARDPMGNGASRKNWLKFYLVRIQGHTDPNHCMKALIEVLPRFNLQIEMKDVHSLTPFLRDDIKREMGIDPWSDLKPDP